jgi:serine protease Do
MDVRLPLPAGTFLDGTYRIVDVIGSGGFGITYLADDTSLETRVAIKEYFPEQFGIRDSSRGVRPSSQNHDATFRWGLESFVREARTLARFRHPSIVQVIRVFEANCTAYMIMALEEGKSFEAWLRGLGRPPSQGELDAIVTPLLDALEIMHVRDFLHRDIAPDNIVIRGDGSPVLLDFGAARRALAEQSRALTGIVKGGYSPQEQYATDARLQGPWTDIYALGATLYRAISGSPPEEATTRSIDDTMLSPDAAAKGLYRPGFLRAIASCLEVRPSNRPQSIAALRLLLAKDEAPLRSGALVPASQSASQSGRDETSAAAADSPGPPVRRAWPVAVTVLCVVAGLIIASWDYRRREQAEWEQATERALIAADAERAEAAQREADAAARERAEAEAREAAKQADARRLVDSVVARVRPTVVRVSVLTVEGEGKLGALPKDHPLRSFLEIPGLRNLSKDNPMFSLLDEFFVGTGAGFIISADGHVVTASSVINRANSLQVTLDDKRKFYASVIGIDLRTQLALLKITAEQTFPFATFASEAARVGDWALTAGDPDRFDGSSGAGVVSAIDRSSGIGPDQLLQIDSPVAGSLGGPSFDRSGNVIGITVKVYEATDKTGGVAFALPAHVAQGVVQQLKQDGTVKRGWLGVKIQNVDNDTASALGLAAAEGALVSEIVADGPAVGKLKMQDAILAVDSAKIVDSRDLARKIADLPPGQTVELRIWRRNQEERVGIVLGTFPAASASAAAFQPDPARLVADRLGVTFAAAKEGSAGAEIATVDPNSDAAAKAIKAGDIILQAGGLPTATPADVASGIEKMLYQGRTAILIQIKSAETVRFVALQLK